MLLLYFYLNKPSGLFLFAFNQSLNAAKAATVYGEESIRYSTSRKLFLSFKETNFDLNDTLLTSGLRGRTIYQDAR